jgi:hypothetical protein
MPRVVHFELPAQDPERAAAFYSSVFGWKFQKWDGPMEYWMVITGEEGMPGINGGLMREDPNYPPRTPVNTVDVSSVDEYVAKITQAGGAVAVPKMAIAGVGYLAYCTDTEGVLFGIMQDDPSAK